MTVARTGRIVRSMWVDMCVCVAAFFDRPPTTLEQRCDDHRARVQYDPTNVSGSNAFAPLFGRRVDNLYLHIHEGPRCATRCVARCAAQIHVATANPTVTHCRIGCRDKAVRGFGTLTYVRHTWVRWVGSADCDLHICVRAEV